MFSQVAKFTFHVANCRQSVLYLQNSRYAALMQVTICLLLQLTLNIPSLARQRCLLSWGPRRTSWFFFFFFVISQLFDAVDYSNYVFWVSETIIQ